MPAYHECTECVACPTLPNAEALKQDRSEKVKQQIVVSLGLIEKRMNPFNFLSSYLNSLHDSDSEKAKVCSDILFELLKVPPTNPPSSSSSGATEEPSNNSDDFHPSKKFVQSFTPELKMKFLLLLRLCPLISTIPDNDNQLLIHCVALMEAPDREILKYLIMANPTALTQTVETRDFGNVTPFHLILLKPEPDHELAFFMIYCNPRVAHSRMEANQKYPLHLVMAQGVPFDDLAEEWQLKLIQKLLAENPEAGFHAINEEIRHLRLLRPQPQQADGDSDSPPTADMTQPPQQQSFQVQVEKRTWTPVEKGLSSSSEKMQALFSKFVEQLTWRTLQAQQQLKRRRY